MIVIIAISYPAKYQMVMWLLADKAEPSFIGVKQAVGMGILMCVFMVNFLVNFVVDVAAPRKEKQITGPCCFSVFV